MSKRVWVIIAVVIVVAAVVVATLLLRGGEKVIRVGALLPLTGEAAPYGKAAQQAIQLAVEEVNAAGGVNGKRVQVVYEDSRLDPKTAASAANKLCDVDKVRAIIGPMASATVEAVLPIAQRKKAVVISPAATAHGLSGKEGFFRTIVSDVYDGTAMAEFAYRKPGFRRVPVLYVEAAGPAGVAQSFIKRFKQLGGTVPVVEVGPPNATDFRAQLTKINAADPDAVYFAAYAVETATILKQAKELGLNKQMLTHQLAEDPEVRERAGEAANGVIYTTPKLDRTTGGPAVKAFYDKFKKKYGEEPRNFASNSYDALKLVVKAITEKSYTFEGIARGLLATKDYPGASGTLSFDSTGDILQPMRLMTIKGGRIIEYTK